MYSLTPLSFRWTVPLRPEKYWQVCAGLLSEHLFSLNFIFLINSLTAAAGSGIFGGYIPLLAGPIPRRWTNVMRPDLSEAQPGLLPAKCMEYRNPENLSRANMVTNLPEIGILPTAAGWFWQRRPVLNPPKGVLAIRKHPLDLGDYMLSKKQSVGVGVKTFAVIKRSSAA
jgi:hypothetical protein